MWWLAGGLALLVVLAIAAAIALVILLGEAAGTSGARADGAPASMRTSPPAPTSTSTPASASRERSAPVRNRPESFPAMRPAADLPPEESRNLGTRVEVSASPLRYRAVGAPGETVHTCFFSADLENVSDQPLAVTFTYRIAGSPRVEWAAERPAELAPGERSERIMGWDGLSPDEAGVTEDECTGPLELARLVVEPG